MTIDRSAGWEAVADQFMAVRSETGAMLVRSWAKDCLPLSTAILDIGCGSGVPIAEGLVNDGYLVWGIDAAPALIAAFRRHLPEMPAACEATQNSKFFGRTFAGAISIGLVFLLDPADQRRLLRNVAGVLQPGGRFLFSAPTEACEWTDTLTGRTSTSLGADAYAAHLARIGLRLLGCRSDEGGNNYYDTVRSA